MGFSPQNLNFPSQQGFHPSRIYCQKSIFVFLTSLTNFSDHFLSALACYYFSDLFGYLFYLFLWRPENGLQQQYDYFWKILVFFNIEQVAWNNLTTCKIPRILSSGESPKTMRPLQKKKWVVFQMTCSPCKSHMSIYCFQSFQDSQKSKILYVSTFLYKFTTQS